jgi:hypothetical protein
LLDAKSRAVKRNPSPIDFSDMGYLRFAAFSSALASFSRCSAIRSKNHSNSSNGRSSTSLNPNPNPEPPC